MKKLLLVLSFTSLCRARFLTSADAFVVAPNGTDASGCGTIAAPCRTLSYAQGLARQGPGKIIAVRAGTYTLSATLTFTAADNGESWLAFPGDASPVIDGNSNHYQIVIGDPNNPVTGFTIEGFTFRNMLNVTGNKGTGPPWAGDIITRPGYNPKTVTIRWNTFLNCGLYCIYGDGMLNSVIDSNTFNGVLGASTSQGADAIISFSGPINLFITHNRFENCSGGGVNLEMSAHSAKGSGNVVDRNIFTNCLTASSYADDGVIYIVDPYHAANGNKITNNVIIGYAASGGKVPVPIKCIYIDDETSHVLVSGNICADGGPYTYGFQIHGGDHNTIVNNIFDLSNGGSLGFYQAENDSFPDHGMGQNIFEQNIVYSSGSFPSTLWYTGYNSRYSDSLPVNLHNLYFSATTAAIPNTNAPDKAPYGIPAASASNPLFAAPSVYNYAMPKSSPAFSRIGFSPLPADQGPLPVAIWR